MRGKVAGIAALIAIFGITPAYAGKSTSEHAFDVFPKDHPRLCGEKVCGVASGKTPIGSPPPMRGKVVCLCNMKRVIGITPAYAGKRTGLICKYPLVRDHPRLCGEKDRANKKMHVVQGSPPPMRGKEVIKATKNLPARITPAYAGKSFFSASEV